jgi:hypothetical protein
MHHDRRWIWPCITIAFVLGCGPQSKLVGLQGDVTFDGHPIETGRIDLVPIDNTAGAAVGATIAGGRYSIPAEKGLLPDGTYQVRITAFRKTGKLAPNRIMPGAPPVELQENFIPAIYNDASTLKLKVKELPDKQKADFQLGTPQKSP